MTGAMLRVWSSSTDPTVRGVEALIQPVSPQDVATSLRCFDLCRYSGDSFFLLPLAPTDPCGVDQAIEAAQSVSSVTRICLSIDEKTLARLDSRQLTGDQVGLVLDRLSLNTSTAAVVHDAIEAVRFDPSFVADSLRSIRIDAALRAMLSLASSLGLATFGSARRCRRSAEILEYPFDYVSELETGAAAFIPPARIHEETLGRTIGAR